MAQGRPDVNIAPHTPTASQLAKLATLNAAVVTTNATLTAAQATLATAQAAAKAAALAAHDYQLFINGTKTRAGVIDESADAV